MTFHTGPAHSLARQVHKWLDAKDAHRCSHCGEHQSWDLSDLRNVYLVDPEGATRADHHRKPTDARTGEDDPLRAPISGNRLIRLTCDNCGHVVLLDAMKVGGELEGEEAEEADF
jgi:hypothetical protein